MQGARRTRKARTRKKIAEVIEQAELTEREKNFCLSFISCWNGAQAARLAGYTGSCHTLRNTAWELLQRPDVKQELRRLKEIKRLEILADGDDLLDLARRVVFADITQFAAFAGGVVALQRSDQVDGQLIKKITTGEHGPTIELKDAKPYLELLVRVAGLDQTEENRDALAKVSELLAGFDEEALNNAEDDA